MKSPPGQLLVADPHQSAPLGAEKRFDHDIASERSKAASASVADCPVQVGGTGRPAASSRASVRYLSTAASTARGGFRTGTPRGREPVQGIHPEDDLLETARRHHPHQDAVDRRQVELARAHDCVALPAGPPPTTADTRGNGTACNDTPSRPAALEVVDMPAKTGNQGDQRRHGSNFRFQIPELTTRTVRCRTNGASTSRIDLARRHASCRSRCSGNTTSAGLNRWGSTA